jgi:hypothetical protein
MIRLRLDGVDSVLESWRTLLAMLVTPLRLPLRRRPETARQRLRDGKRGFRRFRR